MDPNVFITIVLSSLVGLFMLAGAIYAASEARRGGMPPSQHVRDARPPRDAGEETRERPPRS